MALTWRQSDLNKNEGWQWVTVLAVLETVILGKYVNQCSITIQFVTIVFNHLKICDD